MTDRNPFIDDDADPLAMRRGSSGDAHYGAAGSAGNGPTGAGDDIIDLDIPEILDEQFDRTPVAQPPAGEWSPEANAWGAAYNYAPPDVYGQAGAYRPRNGPASPYGAYGPPSPYGPPPGMVPGASWPPHGPHGEVALPAAPLAYSQGRASALDRRQRGRGRTLAGVGTVVVVLLFFGLRMAMRASRDARDDYEPERYVREYEPSDGNSPATPRPNYDSPYDSPPSRYGGNRDRDYWDSRPTSREIPATDDRPSHDDPLFGPEPRSLFCERIEVPGPYVPAFFYEPNDNLAPTAAERATMRDVYGEQADALVTRMQDVKRGLVSMMALASDRAMASDVDGAMFWIQEAVDYEGVDLTSAVLDPRLTPVWRDARAHDLAEYIRKQTWARQDFADIVTETSGMHIVVTPNGSDAAGVALPLLVVLPHAGAAPIDYEQAFGSLADSMGVAMVFVDGSRYLGLRARAWTEGVADVDRVRAAIATASERASIDRSRVILFGHSQGAVAALRVLLEDPLDYAAAILSLPHARSRFRDVAGWPTPDLERKPVMVLGGTNGPSTPDDSLHVAELLSAFNAETRTLERTLLHHVPPRITTALPGWTAQLLELADEGN